MTEAEKLRGRVGPPGVPGAAGAKGEKGDKGECGAAGAVPTFSVDARGHLIARYD